MSKSNPPEKRRRKEMEDRSDEKEAKETVDKAIVQTNLEWGGMRVKLPLEVP